MSIKDGGPAYPFRETMRLNGEPIGIHDRIAAALAKAGGQ